MNPRLKVALVSAVAAACLRKTKTVSHVVDPSAELDRVIGRTEIQGPENPVASVRGPSILDYGVPTCHLSQSDCALKDMNGVTLVYTDSDSSRCYNGDPWTFLVKPGRSDSLYWYFPGGGACFEKPAGGAVEGCYPSLDLGLLAIAYGSGAHDFENPKNYLKDYTFISPPYCSGGGHVSNTTFTADGVTYYQLGYNNAEFVRSWAVRQIGAGIDPVLKSFVMMGSSAGSLGLGAWADTLLGNFRAEKASVIFDSYMGVFPDGAEGGLVQALGACSVPPLAPFRDECNRGDLKLDMLIQRVVSKYPNVAFAHIQSKEDAIQLLFFSLIGFEFGKWPLVSTPTFYYISNILTQGYNMYPNYLSYVVDGDFHVFPPYPVEWYSTSIAGPNTTAPAGTPMLWEWIGQLINHEPVTSQCNGPRSANNFWSTSFCDEAIFNSKQLQV